MAKDTLYQYDVTAANNTDVGGINVDEGMLPSGVNNAIRELMSHQKEFVTGAFLAGTGNVALGDQALDDGSLSGNYNTAVGSGALTANTTASYNTAVGYQAGYTNTQSYANTFLGYQAGYSFSGSAASTYNTFLGYSSGYLITTGTKNTIIGTYSGNQGGLDIRTSSNYLVLSDGDGNPRQVIDSNGDLLMGCVQLPSASFLGGAAFQISNSSELRFSIAGTGNSTRVRFYNANGEVGAIRTNGSATDFVTSSDQRLKSNIQDAFSASAKIDAIQVRQFDWTSDGRHQDYGLVAQELQLVEPLAVSVSDSEDALMGVDYSKLVPMLIKEIQELRMRVAALES